MGGSTTGLTANLTTLIVVPDTATVALAGGGANGSASNMTIEFRTDGSGNLMTPVRVLNMGSGFKYGDVITIPTSITGHGSAATTLTLTAPTGKSNGDDINVPGGMFEIAQLSDVQC